MPVRVIWSDTALNELTEIKNYIENESSSETATAVIEQIFRATRRLRDFPELGRIISDFDLPTHRELIVLNYRVMYRVGEFSTDVMHVLRPPPWPSISSSLVARFIVPGPVPARHRV
jgi:addiction module RelE/StbE family toxin